MPSGGADDAGPGSNELQDTEESSLHLGHVKVIARILGKGIQCVKLEYFVKHHHHLLQNICILVSSLGCHNLFRELGQRVGTNLIFKGRKRNFEKMKYYGQISEADGAGAGT